ncbi:peptidoglycan -binding protein [Cognatishimia activa]|uniref:Chemotaxis protein MotB n=1 Tax=Cognatishimia activa TaxID=1715691 RepID=A0A0N7MBU0_9RHOB|nr:peptidoglycan -binding protein [Cognatishimia activa]CUI62967.1 Chemotaxis protein MotB [Cognatishimia activa]CUK26344.1 Chemotaxis protein MotB [Cognatishimia activa]
MALSRRTGQRFQASIWPGFVDAMTGLLLVLMFVLTIFMVVQFVLRETISGQESKLDELSLEVAALAQALGLEQDRGDALETQVGTLRATLTSAEAFAQQQAALIATLTQQRDDTAAALETAQTQITSFEAQVAALISERDTVAGALADVESQRDQLLTEQEALNLALAQARTEIDDQVEAARLAAAQREALEAMVAEMEAKALLDAESNAALAAQVNDLEAKLSEEELARLAEAAAAESLRERLENASAELTAMTLALEEQRKRAEETLTLLAAAEQAREGLDVKLAAALLALTAAEEEGGQLSEVVSDLTARLEFTEGNAAQQQARLEEVERQLAAALAARLAAETAADQDRADIERQLASALAAQVAAEQAAAAQLSEAEERARLLAIANETLEDTRAQATESEKQAALLNQQVAALRQQLGELQALLDDSKARDAAAQVQLSTLGSDLNAALARAAAEERRRRELEEAERIRLEAEAARLASEAQNLEQYRSEFFGRMRALLGNREGVRIVGDRFVFSSEVLFPPGGAELSFAGRQQIAGIAQLLQDVADEIPPEIDWVLQVDGHTDNIPLINGAQFRDNWELSQARALSVVRFMASDLGLPPNRLSANGFGEYQPLDPASTREARAKNRRIELKFTEK